MKKRFCSLLLSLAMLLGLLPGWALAGGGDAPVWDLLDASTEQYADHFGVSNSSGGGTVSQESGYVNITKGNDKSNTASGSAYTWLTSSVDLPSDQVFTVEAAIRLSGPVDGSRTNEFSVRVDGTGKYFPIFLQYGAEGGVTNLGDFSDVQAVDTTQWHFYALVIDPTNNYYKVYVDGVLVLEQTSNWGLSGKDLIRLGADNKGRCDMDVASVRAGTGDLSAYLTAYDGPEYPKARLSSVTLSQEGHTEGTEAQVTVTVAAAGMEDGTPVEVTLVDADGAAVEGAAATGTLSGNAAEILLTIPASVPQGTYYVEAAAAGSSARSGPYTVATSLASPDFPTFSAVGYTIEMADYQYNPTEEFNFPTVVDTQGHEVENEITEHYGQTFRYYLFYAPHDNPGGNCVAVSNSLDGPWLEYEGNPVVSRVWAKEDGTGNYYSVSHVSSPHVMWLEEQGCYIMYYHGENTTTRYALSDDLINWTYGGEILRANDFSTTGSGFSEASYARVFQHEIPGLGNKYIMLLMITGSGNNMHRNIYYAYSSDGIAWTAVQESLLDPDVLGSQYKDNFSGPWFMEWEVDGETRYFVICHASSGEIYAFEVGESLDQCIQWGEVYNSQGVRNVDDANPDCYPDYGRSGAPFFIQDDEGRWHMYYEAGKRLNTNIVHAVQVLPGEEEELSRAGLTLDTASLQVGDTAQAALRVFNKSNQQVTEGLTLTYHVSDSQVLSFEDGLVTALGEGSATIWVTVEGQDGSTAVSEKVEVSVALPASLLEEVILTNADTPGKTALNLELASIFKAEGVLEDPIDRYYLYFSYNDESGGTRSIALATAPSPQGPWTVYEEGAPVITKESLGVSGAVNAPWPIWDEENGRMLMYYSMGTNTIGVAESTDGVHFTNLQTVLTGSDAPAGTQAYQQSVYEYTVEGLDNKYLMLYTGNGYRSEDGTYTNGKQIFYAVSDDGIHWTAAGSVLQFPDSGDKGNIASPRLLVEDGEAYVLYHNSNGNIGYSRLSADFTTATRMGKYYDSTDGEPDRGRAADAVVYQEAGRTYLYYTARSNKAKNEADASMLVCRLLSVSTQVLFEDDFEDGDAEGWDPVTGSWSVEEGAYLQSAAGSAQSFAGSALWADYEVEVTVTPLSTTKNVAFMVSGRVTDANNRYIGSYNGGKLTINCRNGGKDTELASKSYSMAPGETYTLKLVLWGNQIELWVNGVKELEAADSTHTSGMIGLATYNTSARFDNVVVRGVPVELPALTLDDFGDHQVIQRDAELESALVEVSGAVTAGETARVEVRVMDYGAQGEDAPVVDWTEVAFDLAEGTWSGTLTVPQGGWYRLEVRALDSAGQVLASASGSRKWGVGILILCIGQSNMVGQGSAPYTQAHDLVANYTRSGGWAHLTDPYDGAGGSMVPALGNYLVETLGIPVGFIPAADSGSGLHAPNVGHAANRYWMYYNEEDPGDTSTLYGKALTRVKAAGGVELIVWNQGETDGRLEVSQEDYEADMRTLLQRFRTDLEDASIPMFLCQIGTHNPNISSDAAYTAIRSAQHDLDDGENFFLAATEMEFARKDTAHYTQSGLNEIGRRVAHTILYYYGLTDYYRGPYISAAQFTDSTRQVIDLEITHRGGDDITPVGEEIPGFTVLDGEQEVEVTSALRLDGNTIRLTLAQPAAGEAVVRYLYGLNPFAEAYDPNTTVSDLQQDATVVKDNTEMALPLENTTDGVPVAEAEPEEPDTPDIPDTPVIPVTPPSTTTTETLPDGTQVVTREDAGGTVTVTITAPDGTVTVTVTAPGGEKEISVTLPEGALEGEARFPADLGEEDGLVSVEVTYPGGRVDTVTGSYSGGLVSLPVAGSAALRLLDDFVPLSALVFSDVEESAYYFMPVYWAAARGITNGTSGSTFSPALSCTRAQMVTFLWRAAGSPAPQSGACPYTDVDPAAWYYEAVLWAVEQGITNGTSATTFHPEEAVTRAQAVTFLWRAAGRPAPQSAASPYADVDPAAWYYEAVLWAAEQGITNGTSAATFHPEEAVTRAQAVTFLYRSAVKAH